MKSECNNTHGERIKTDNSVLWLMISNNLEEKKFIVFVNENCDKITVAFETGSRVDNMQ